MSDSQENRDDKLRKLAYSLWDAAGRPLGREDEFWRQAEELLHKEHLAHLVEDLDSTGEESFPASDAVNRM